MMEVARWLVELSQYDTSSLQDEVALAYLCLVEYRDRLSSAIAQTRASKQLKYQQLIQDELAWIAVCENELSRRQAAIPVRANYIGGKLTYELLEPQRSTDATPSHTQQNTRGSGNSSTIQRTRRGHRNARRG